MKMVRFFALCLFLVTLQLYTNPWSLTATLVKGYCFTTVHGVATSLKRDKYEKAPLALSKVATPVAPKPLGVMEGGVLDPARKSLYPSSYMPIAHVCQPCQNLHVHSP